MLLLVAGEVKDSIVIIQFEVCPTGMIQIMRQPLRYDKSDRSPFDKYPSISDWVMTSSSREVLAWWEKHIEDMMTYDYNKGKKGVSEHDLDRGDANGATETGDG